MAVSAGKRERTCIGCGSRSDKKTLHRIVRTKDGSVGFDETGRVAGRGAYVCSSACFKEAARTRKVQRALRANVGPDELERIASELEKALREEGIR